MGCCTQHLCGSYKRARQNVVALRRGALLRVGLACCTCAYALTLPSTTPPNATGILRRRIPPACTHHGLHSAFPAATNAVLPLPHRGCHYTLRCYSAGRMAATTWAVNGWHTSSTAARCSDTSIIWRAHIRRWVSSRTHHLQMTTAYGTLAPSGGVI